MLSEKRTFWCYNLGETGNENKKIEKENSLYSEKKCAKYDIKMVQNRSKTFCPAFLSNTSNYWSKKLFGKTAGREEERETLIHAHCLYIFLGFLISISLPAIT